MKFLKTLIIFLIVNDLTLGGENSPLRYQISDDLIQIDLPKPLPDSRQKFIINVSDNLGYVCHNQFREREIKDKLFELQTKNDACSKIEEIAVKPTETGLEDFGKGFQKYALGGAIGMVIGLLLPSFIKK